MIQVAHALVNYFLNRSRHTCDRARSGRNRARVLHAVSCEHACRYSEYCHTVNEKVDIASKVSSNMVRWKVHCVLFACVCVFSACMSPGSAEEATPTGMNLPLLFFFVLLPIHSD